MVFSPTPDRRATSFWLSPRSLRISRSFSTRSMASSSFVTDRYYRKNGSEPSHQTNDHALHRDVAGCGIDRTHHGVGRLQPDFLPFLIEALERDLPVDIGDDHLAVVGTLAAGDDDQISIEDPVIDHRVSAHLQHVVLTACSEVLGNGDGLGRNFHIERST